MVGFGAFYLGRQTTPQSPTSSSFPTIAEETVTWKTYINPTYNYELKYPDIYKILPQTEKEKSQLGVDTNTCLTLNDTQQCILLINYWPNSFEELLKLKAPTNFSKATPQDFSSTNVKGKKYVYEIGQSTTQVVILIPKPNSNTGVFEISYTNYPGEIETVKKLEQIVSTFKFKNQTEADETENWKTYTNTKEGFSIKYPDQWDLQNPSGPSDPTTIKFVGPVLGESNIPEPVRPSAWVIIGGPGKATTASEVVDNSIKQISSQDPNFKLSSREKIKVDGVDAEWTIGFPSRSGTVQVYALKNSKVYEFFFDPYDPIIKEWESTKYADIFRKMLSTVKFTQ